MSSKEASERAGMLSAARLTRLLWVFSVVLVTLSAVLLLLNRNVEEDPVAPYWLNLAATALALSTVGALVASRRPENPIGWLLGASGLLYAVMVSVGEYGTYALLTERGSQPGGVVAAWLGSWLYVLGANLVLYSFLLFPDGRLPSPRWRVVAWLVALAICLDTASLALMPGTLYGYPGFDNPFGIEALAGLSGPIGVVTSVLVLVAILAPVIALIVRFRRARGDERQQIKWVIYAVAVLGAAIVAVNLWPALDPSFVGAVMFLVGFLAIPVAIGVAIFKYRLYDIDLVINRTLVYGALTACVVGVYVLVVGYLGALLRTEDNLAISLVATGVVAVLFAPLRDLLQRGVNRLMYGERDEPYTAVSRLGERLEGTLAPEAVLPAIVETVREALKLPYAAIALPRDGNSLEVVTTSGEEPPADPLILPLSYGGESVGELLLAPRAPGESFSAADRRLLDGLARHAGVAVHGVRVMADLQRSRERLVLAREEERRRLRRDLHDELAPTLAALGLSAATVGELIPTDPKEAASANEKLRAAIRATVGDVRRLVYDLRPPALDELGLVEAVRERASRHSAQAEGFLVTVEAPDKLPPLPAAVEVAAYRIVQEALTNVSRHARASACSVRLACPDGRVLEVEITDNGVGLPDRPGHGVGLSSMRERAAELGGECEIVRSSPSGTRVFARLPLREPLLEGRKE